MSATDSSPARARLSTFRVLLLIAAIALVFGRTAGFEFTTWDDDINVTSHAAVLRGDARGLIEIWREPYAKLYAPVGYTLWWLLAAISNTFFDALEPGLFHAANVLVHAANALLVLRLLRRFVTDERAAFAGTMVFALHPLQVESVAWITDLRGLSSAFFALVALDVLLADARARAIPMKRATWRFALSAVLFALALLAKPQAAALPLAVLLIERTLGRSWRAALGVFACGALLSIGVALGASALQAADAARVDVTPTDRVLVALDSLGFYVRQLLVPIGLSIDYGRTPSVALTSNSAWLHVSIAVAAAIVAWRARLLLSFSLFVAFLLPVLGLVPFGFQEISTVADRYAYLSMIGAGLAVALALERWGARFAAAVTVALIAVLGVASFRQTSWWRDSRTLFERALAQNPKSFKALSNQAFAANARNETTRAIELYRRALAAKPDHVVALQNLGLVLCQRGELDEGVRLLERAAWLRPDDAAIQQGLGSAWLARADGTRAETHLRRATELDPSRALAHELLGTVLLSRGDASGAGAALEAALALRDSADARMNLATVRAQLGDLRAAITHLERALVLRPSWPLATDELAWILATSSDANLRDPNRSLALSEALVSAERVPVARHLDTLAAALAANARFDEAVKRSQEALALARNGDAALVPRIEARAQVYADGEAWFGPR